MSPSFPAPAPARDAITTGRARPHSNPSGWLGYNGQLHEPDGGWWQFLGNGYRVYNPVLMRFHSPDSMSPLGKGGINAYAYCAVDPVNRADPSGHWALSTLFTTLVPFKFKAMPAAGMLAAAAASLGFAGVAVSTKDDTQKGLVIAASVVAAVGALVAGRYAFVKGKPRVAAGNGGAPSSIPKTPTTGTTVSTPSTSSTPVSPQSPASSASPASRTPPGSQVSRPSSLAIGAPVQVAFPRPPPKRPAMRAPPPPAPLVPSVRHAEQGAPVELKNASIRKLSNTWDVAWSLRT